MTMRVSNALRSENTVVPGAVSAVDRSFRHRLKWRSLKKNKE